MSDEEAASAAVPSLTELWADLEEVPWYALHLDRIEYARRFGYPVIGVPPEIAGRWQRVQAEARAVHAEIEAAFDALDEQARKHEGDPT